MKSLFILVGLFSLALFVGTTNARKHPGEYWQGQGDLKEQPKLEFETKPNLHVYSDDIKPRDENLFAKKFERKSSFWVYNDEDAKQREEKPLRNELETKPNFWVYSDDVKPRDEN